MAGEYRTDIATVRPDRSGTFCVVAASGEYVIREESMGVCSNIEWALNNRNCWAPGECQEIADNFVGRCGDVSKG